MATAPLKQCRVPRCNGYAVPDGRGYCEAHKANLRQQYIEYNQRRRDPVTVKWLNSARYKQEREHFLRENPLCSMCSRQGVSRPASILDHVEPHNGCALKFWDRSNWQALCAAHHGEKRALEKKAPQGGGKISTT